MLHMFFKKSGTQTATSRLGYEPNNEVERGRRVGLGVREYTLRRMPCFFAPSGWIGAAEGQRMDRVFFPLLTMALQWFRPQYNV